MYKQEINFRKNVWLSLIKQLRLRSRGRHESGAFLLGVIENGNRTVSDVIYYDDLDPNAYSTGACILCAGAFSILWKCCRDKKLTVVADIHTHPFGAQQSLIDQKNPMVARSGHVAIILPQYAKLPVKIDRIGVYIYQGNYKWNDESPWSGSNFLSL